MRSCRDCMTFCARRTEAALVHHTEVGPDMKRLTGKLTRAAVWLALCVALLFCAPSSFAQGEEPPVPQEQEGASSQQQGGPADDRAGLLKQLNLTPEQVAQIREVRRQSEPEGRALVRRVNVARRALDEAIYSDGADEALIQERARALAEAQAAATRMRAQVEWRIRRVLTPAQLNTLRELRQQARRQRIERRRGRGDARTSPADAFNQSPARRPGETDDDTARPRRTLQRLRRRGMIPRRP